MVLLLLSETCLLYSKLFLFWIWDFTFLLFSIIFVFPLYVVLDIVSDTLSSMMLFFDYSDTVSLYLLFSPKLNISSSEYEISIRLNFLLMPTYFELILLFPSLLIWLVLFFFYFLVVGSSDWFVVFWIGVPILLTGLLLVFSKNSVIFLLFFLPLFVRKSRFVFVIHCFKYFTGIFLYSSSEWSNHFLLEAGRLSIFS